MTHPMLASSSLRTIGPTFCFPLKNVYIYFSAMKFLASLFRESSQEWFAKGRVVH